jgi:hypothetical protein
VQFYQSYMAYRDMKQLHNMHNSTIGMFFPDKVSCSTRTTNNILICSCPLYPLHTSIVDTAELLPTLSLINLLHLDFSFFPLPSSLPSSCQVPPQHHLLPLSTFVTWPKVFVSASTIHHTCHYINIRENCTSQKLSHRR